MQWRRLLFPRLLPLGMALDLFTVLSGWLVGWLFLQEHVSLVLEDRS